MVFKSRPKQISIFASIFVAVELFLALIGGTSAVVLYLGFAWLDHFHLLLYFLAFLIGFGIGLEIPLLLRINERWRSQLSDNVGEILSLDYVGALIGALVWAFVMLPVLPLDKISLILGLANLGAALLTWYLLKPAINGHLKLLILFLGVTAVLITVSLNAASWKDKARQRLFAYPIQHSQHSPYQSLVVTGSGARMSLYLNGRLQFDSEDEFIYHEMLVHPAMNAAKKSQRILVLGGGDGLAARAPTEEEIAEAAQWLTHRIFKDAWHARSDYKQREANHETFQDFYRPEMLASLNWMRILLASKFTYTPGC